MPHKRGSSPAVIVFLIAAILCIFVLQIPLQEEETKAETPRGADLAVIGGTTAALLSALEAADNGAQVFLFPNGQELGEDSSFLVTGGLAAALTPPQKVLEIEFGPETFVERIKERGGGLNDPALLEAFISSQDLYQEIGKISGFFFDLLPQPELRPYLHLSSQSNADLLFKHNLLERLENSTVIVCDEKVGDLFFTSRGQLEAVILEDAQGNKEQFYIQAAILADGGYSGVVYHRHDYLPADNLVDLRPAQKGEGLQLAEALGLDLVQMGFLNARLLLYAPLEGSYLFLPLDPWEDTYFINTAGRVLSWEEASYQEAVNFIFNSPPGGSFIMAPEDRAEAFGSFFRRFDNLEGMMKFYSFASLPSFPGTRPPAPPYYTAPLRAGIDYTLGGIAVTARGEVKKNGNVVKGLYAAGEIVGGLHGEALLPGMALSETLFLAKTAGEAAAEYSRR